MKISLEWLRDYIDTDLSVDRMCDTLTAIGLEVEGNEVIKNIKGGLEGIIVGEVVSCTLHPNADRLRATEVNIGTENNLSIVCGAPNVAQGQKVAIAPVGTTLHSGEDTFEIKKVKLRGVVSEGMICSEKELHISDEHEGIMVLPSDYEIGKNLSYYIEIKENHVIEIGITPNRSDALSHWGVARDLCAALAVEGEHKVTFNHPQAPQINLSPESKKEISVEVLDYSRCPRYSGVVIDGLHTAPSPQWLQDRLEHIGLTPLNNIIDITNYVQHHLGQPLHAFDYHQIKGEKVIVRPAHQGEKITTLDGKERTLHADDLMIADETDSMCIGGVFGGLTSGVSDSTTCIFLECAHFNKTSIRRTSKRHELHTDASFRYERGADPTLPPLALATSIKLLYEIAGGHVASEIIDLYPNPINKKEITLRLPTLESRLGVKIQTDKVKQILSLLDFEIADESDEQLTLFAPLYRVDVVREIDVIEEIARIYGYDHIPTASHFEVALPTKNSFYAFKQKLNQMMSHSGYSQMIANSLTKEAYISIDDTIAEDSYVEIKNPLGIEYKYMRRTLLYGMLEALKASSSHSEKSTRLYESGRIYQKTYKDQTTDTGTSEHERMALLISGPKTEEVWGREVETFAFFDLKGEVYRLLHSLQINKERIKEKRANGTQTIRSQIDIFVDKKKIGYIGEVSTPLLAEAFDMKETKSEVLYAELDIEALYHAVNNTQTTYQTPSKYPSVRRDVAFVIDTEVSYSEIETEIRASVPTYITDVQLFDVYEDDKLGKDKKSYAFAITFSNSQKTFVEKEITSYMNKITRRVEKKFSAVLRDR